MSFQLLLIVVFGSFAGTVCDNFTDKYPSGNFQTRQGKLLTFNTKNDDEISIELEFNVPFLSIPIKPSMDMAKGTVANLNIGAVVLAGAVAFGAAILIPAAYHLVNKPMAMGAGAGGEGGGAEGDSYLPTNEAFGNRYRTNGESSSMWSLMANIDRALSENHIDSTSCMQRAICWTVKNSNSNLINGQATSSDKIIDGLATNGWVTSLVDGSVFKAAIDSGLAGENCTKVYNQCKINQETIQTFGKQLISAIYSKK